jgi:glucokinase
VTSVLGIDLGATKVAAALVETASGEISHAKRIATRPRRGGEAVLDDCIALAEQVIGGRTVAAIGVGVCELVDLDGNITSNYSFDWRNVDVSAALAHLAPTCVESDVRAAARAEAAVGAGRGLHSFLYVNAGSGISSTLVVDGVPLAGARGNAILIGAGPLNVEERAGGIGIAHSARMDSAADVIGAAERGNHRAAAVLEQAGTALGEAVAFAANLLDPELVVLGGGVALASPRYRSALENAMRTNIWAESTRTLTVVTTQLGADAGIIGAALAATRTHIGAPS